MLDVRVLDVRVLDARVLDERNRPEEARLPLQCDLRDNVTMRSRTLVFAVFAVAMLISVVREWSAPSGCPRRELTRSDTVSR